MAILGYRAYSYPLVEMRVDNINVVGGLNRYDEAAPNPDKPRKLDGIAEGQLTKHLQLAESTTPTAEPV